MKKVKLMLLSLSILAVVGGALAFTVNTTVDFCTAPTVNGNCPSNYDCPDPAALKAGASNQFLCTTPTIIGQRLDECHFIDGSAKKCGVVSAQSTPE